jgi:hypothetical protein
MEAIYITYLHWNGALYNHFFGRNDSEEVFLYINKEVLDQIGNEAKPKLGGSESFLNTVLLNKDDRYTLARDLFQKGAGLRVPWERPYNTSLFSFAEILTNPDLTRKINCPFLCYVVLAVYIASTAQDMADNAIGKRLNEFIKDHLEDNGRRESLDILFKALHKCEPRFNNLKLTKQAYVGLLKYQLVLSGNQIERLKRTLYQNIFTFNEETTYSEKIYKIIEYSDEEMQRLLKNSLNSKPHQKRISDIIDSFDPDVFAETHQEEDKKQRKLIGKFVYAIDCRGNSPQLIYLTDIIENLKINSQDVSYEVLESLDDNIAGYNPNPVRTSQQICIGKNRKINTNEYSIDFPQKSEIIFLKEYGNVENAIYIESQNLNDSEACIIVRNNKRTSLQFQKYCCEGAITDIERVDLPNILGEEWILYTGRVTFHAKTNDNGNYVRDNNPTIRMAGGIKPKGKNVYVANALPYFQFPYAINRETLNVSISIEDKALSERSDYHLLVINDKLIIDLTNDQLFNNDWPLCMNVNITDNNLSIEESFTVCGQDIQYAEEDLYAYNRWGELTSGVGDNIYIQGSTIHGIPSEEYRAGAITFNLRAINEDDSQSFYFINLIATCCYMNNGQAITKDRLMKCIRYAATRVQLDNSSDSGFVRRVCNLLINSGYICPSYEGSTHYQAMPPTFIKVPGRPGIGGDRFHATGVTYNYMLVGCYTRKFISQLKEYCNKKGLQLMTKLEDGVSTSLASKLMPPVIILDNQFDPEEFQTVCPCNYVTNDYVSQFLEMLPSIEDYANTNLETIENDNMNINLIDTNEKCPRVRTSIATNHRGMHNYYIENDDGTFKSGKDKDWMSLYCRFCKGEPILTSSQNEICFPTDVHLPYLFQRVLFIMNNGQPQFIKAFICNNSGTDKLYNTLKVYNIGTVTEHHTKLLSLLSSKSNRRDSVSIRKYKIEIGTRKDKFGTLPKYVMILKDSTSTVAFALINTNGSQEVYIEHDGSYRGVNGLANDIFSRLMTDKFSRLMTDERTYQQLGIELLNSQRELPDINNYDIQELIIK